jgi:hypothetical protein
MQERHRKRDSVHAMSTNDTITGTQCVVSVITSGSIRRLSRIYFTTRRTGAGERTATVSQEADVRHWGSIVSSWPVAVLCNLHCSAGLRKITRGSTRPTTDVAPLIRVGPLMNEEQPTDPLPQAFRSAGTRARAQLPYAVAVSAPESGRCSSCGEVPEENRERRSRYKSDGDYELSCGSECYRRVEFLCCEKPNFACS